MSAFNTYIQKDTAPGKMPLSLRVSAGRSLTSAIRTVGIPRKTDALVSYQALYSYHEGYKRSRDDASSTSALAAFMVAVNFTCGRKLVHTLEESYA